MKRRVVVLGAGVAGLSAAHELTRTPEARAAWDVTLFERGHRPGGRLASAHRPEASGRNEEHGLHVWFGFYENTFRFAEEVWAEWRRPASCPWETVWDGLRPVYTSQYGDPHGERYVVHRGHHPRNALRPGDGPTAWASAPTAWIDVVRALPRTLASFLAGVDAPVADVPAVWPGPAEDAVIRRAEAALLPLGERLAALARATDPGRREALAARIERGIARLHGPLVRGAARLAGENPGARELVTVLDVGLALLRGLLSPRHGFVRDGDLARASAWEFRGWLALHGADARSLRRSRVLDALYDAAFAYRDGDRRAPVLEASTGARAFLRVLFTYKHALAWLLSAGATETLVAPAYEVLRDRGVGFRWFHRLVRLELGGGRVTRLAFARGARPRPGYEPLVERDGFRGFSPDPDWTQLEDGAALRARGVDFYSRFAPPGEEIEVVLEVGRDFDDVVLALPLGCVVPDADGHTPVRAWLDAVPAAGACVARLHLVPTVAAQLWLREPAAEVGLDGLAMCGWAPPLSIVCDMSPVIRHEAWPTPAPGGCAYLCGAWPLASVHAPSTDTGAPARDLRAVEAVVRAQLDRHLPELLPGATLHHAQGADPLAAQYVRVNVQPWDLADLPLPGADADRLGAADSGLENLALAGAWVRSPVNTTSVEAAVASGVAAARALGGPSRPVFGEGWLAAPPARLVLPGREPGEEVA
ncbi:MAG: FAD-dependent oxidoreductase [Myxococcota bacterium]